MLCCCVTYFEFCENVAWLYFMCYPYQWSLWGLFAASGWARNFCTFIHAVCLAGYIAWRAYREGILYNKPVLSLGIRILIAVLCVVFINCNFVHHTWFSSPTPTSDISWDCFWFRCLNCECVVFTVCASESGSEQWTPLQWNFS